MDIGIIVLGLHELDFVMVNSPSKHFSLNRPLNCELRWCATAIFMTLLQRRGFIATGLVFIVMVTLIMLANRIKTEPTVPSRGKAKLAMKEVVRAKIRSAKVVVFAKSYCPYCVRVKNMFKDMGIAFKTFDMDQMGRTCTFKRLMLVLLCR